METKSVIAQRFVCEEHKEYLEGNGIGIIVVRDAQEKKIHENDLDRKVQIGEPAEDIPSYMFETLSVCPPEFDIEAVQNGNH